MTYEFLMLVMMRYLFPLRVGLRVGLPFLAIALTPNCYNLQLNFIDNNLNGMLNTFPKCLY